MVDCRKKRSRNTKTCKTKTKGNFRCVKRKQVGETIVKVDKKLKAKHPGKRISKSGNVYYEYRRNRSDKCRDKRKL